MVQGAPELVGELCGDYLRLARASGIPDDPMRNPDMPISVKALLDFLDQAASKLHCEAFGLRLGQYQNFSLFGQLAPLLNSATTIGEMLQDLVSCFPFHTQGMIVGIFPSGSGVMITYEIAYGGGGIQRQPIELGCSVLVQELRRQKHNWQPQEVYFRHAAPIDISWHRKILGDNVFYNSDRNAIYIEPEFLLQKTLEGDVKTHSSLAQQLIGGSADESILVTRVEALVRAMLPYAIFNLSTAAKMLRISTRTLQRRLAENDTSISQIIENVKFDLSKSYLSESSLTVAEIAEILQFSETSALSRAVNRWHNASPREVRAIAKLAHLDST